MSDTSERMISLSEARTALRCMLRGGLSEDEALDCLEETVDRVRGVTTAAVVEDIIEENLTDIQRDYIRKYWYEQKNTLQIARECGVSQASVYRTIERAHETIKELMTPVMKYREIIKTAEVIPLIQEALEISAAQKRTPRSFCEALGNLRTAEAISTETMARALNISVNELKEIESGIRIPSTVTAMRYSAVFGIEITMKFVNGRGIYEWKKA